VDVAVVQRRFRFLEGRVERFVGMRRRSLGAVGLVRYVIGLSRRIGVEVGVAMGNVGRVRLLGHSP